MDSTISRSCWPAYPAIYELNTWVWLSELSRKAGRRITLQTVPQEELERLAAYGFDACWLMGVWQRTPGSRQLARELAFLQEEYRRVLPDYTADDVLSSPYAIGRYQVDEGLGGDEGLDALRERLHSLGLRLLLDFVPNHLAVDHDWVEQHPERLVQGTLADLQETPERYFSARGRILAHGRDPNFPSWTDTVQLDYRRPETRRAMADLLRAVAGRCDGLRCDMAMLVLRDVFLRTWGGQFEPPEAEFWPSAIAEVKAAYPDFLMLAEVYWDLEYTLQQMGFDYTYDKRLYDRLVEGDAGRVREHLRLAGPEYQQRLVRFIENHDEQRARTVLGPQRSRAAAVVALTLPGARLLHQGQIEGFRLKVPVQLARGPQEPPDPDMEPFYRQLLAALRQPIFHYGRWHLLETQEAWFGNPSHSRLIAYRWSLGPEKRIVVVNLAADRSQGFLQLDQPDLAGHTWEFEDLLNRDGDRPKYRYVREGDDLSSRGLYLDMPGEGYHLFDLRMSADGEAAVTSG